MGRIETWARNHKLQFKLPTEFALLPNAQMWWSEFRQLRNHVEHPLHELHKSPPPLRGSSLIRVPAFLADRTR